MTPTVTMEAAVAIGLAGWILSSGPALLALRWLARRLGTTDPRRAALIARAGLALAVMGAVGLEVLRSGAPLVPVAVLVVGLLALLDRAWRWLPPEWSLILGAIGLWFALGEGRLEAAFLGGILPAAGLWLLRGILWHRLGEEPLGLGDVWLIAAIGVWTGPVIASLVLGIAALFGLSEVVAARVAKGGRTAAPPQRAVAFGTHICTVFAIAAFTAR